MSPPTAVSLSPGLSSFLRNLKIYPIDTSIENLISLLKRRQIHQSHSCAVATAYLLMRVVSMFRTTDPEKLIERVQQVGRRIVAAQPREMVVGNIVRRVLGLIRDEAENERFRGLSQQSDAGSDTRPHTPQQNTESQSFHHPELPATSSPSPLRRAGTTGDLVDNTIRPLERLRTLSPFESITRSNSRPPLLSHPSFSVTTTPPVISMFNLLSYPRSESPQPGSPVSSSSPSGQPNRNTPKDFKAEVIDGINEIVDELGQVDDQIAAYALEHIHSNEVILTHTSSATVQRFLLKAAAKRKFTVIHVESYPNNHRDTHAVVTGAQSGDDDGLTPDSFRKPLTALGITVILIPDSAVFALMSRVNKVILGTHSVLANGGLVAAAGTRVIATAAKAHKTPVVVVSGIYKLSPVYPFDYESLIEYGDANNVVDYQHSDFVEGIDVLNPIYDYVPAELVDLYITNIGGHAPSFLYRIVSDHYRSEDITF
ncbi:GCD complex subunit gcd7 [Myotisia sp. PD_48]|nr:GCD complex subunit gcd7 [Myotisia sp. PD_48]